jgi:hypothetical protein
MFRISITTLVAWAIVFNLAFVNSEIFGQEIFVSPAVAEKAAMDAQRLKKEQKIKKNLVLPGDYPGVESRGRAAMKGITSDNRRIQHDLRSLNNSIRNMNTKINRINTLNRRGF